MVEETVFEGHECVLACPHCAIDWLVNFRLILLLVAVIMLIAVWMAMIGAWLVLPFAGLEALFVVIVTWYWHKTRKQRETFLFDGDELVFTRQQGKKKIQFRSELFWTRLIVQRDTIRCHAQQQLFIKNRDQFWPIASFLSDDEKQQLIKALARHLAVVRL